MAILDSDTIVRVSERQLSGIVSTDVESSDMEVVVELGVPGASEGVMGSAGGRLIRVGGPDMAYSVNARMCIERCQNREWRQRYSSCRITSWLKACQKQLVKQK